MREDIQCLRGFAIILVFIFHLCPNLFVNGFLGVDIFFVISGFLMAKNLTHSMLSKPMDFVSFYYKRFRRILPLYYVMVFIIVVMVHLYLGPFLWENNNRYAMASLFLVTNQLVIADEANYFNEFLAERSSVNVFLHLWSLSVEMQFYILVPFIFLGLQILKNNYLKLIAVSIITTVGFVAFDSTIPQFAFNFVFLRLWQFSAGFMALFWNKMNLENHSKKLNESNRGIFERINFKDDFMTVSLVILTGCLLPSTFNVRILRPTVTLATAVILGCESNNFLLLKSKLLAYIGDISYVMYLVHWPVIAIFLGTSLKSYLFVVLTTLLSSVLLHHVYETRYLKMDWKALVPFIFALILCNSYLQSSVREHSFWNSTLSKEIQDIVYKNQALLPYSWANDPMTADCVEIKKTDIMDSRFNFGYGNCPSGNGSLSVMMIGNSYVMNFRDPIRRLFNNNFSEFRYMSLAHGYGFYDDFNLASNAMDLFREQVKKNKPDILFITSRYSATIQTPVQDNDEYLKQMNENIAFYEKYTKKIYILNSFPLYRRNFISYFLQYVMTRPDETETLHLDRRVADQQIRNVQKRFSMVKCEKCKFSDLSHVFLENDKYLTYDRDQMLSYIDNSIHITKVGIDVCMPELKKVVDEAMNTFHSSSSSMNAFLHLWSLSLEMQFYLLVPFIFLGLQFLKKDYLKLVAVTLITVFGFIGFIVILDKFAFNFLFLRLWQFSAGFISLFWIKMNENKLPKKTESPEIKKFENPTGKQELVIVALSILTLCLIPNEINVSILRPLITLSTAFIIGCEVQNIQLLKSETLVYIGDISYVMYLVHWPIISIFHSSAFKSYLFCIVFILVVSIILHHIFEKQYLKLEMKAVIPLVFLLIVGNAYLQYSIRNDDFWKYPYSAETKEIIERNHESYAPLYDFDTRKGKCMEKDLDVPFEKNNLLGYCRFPPGKGNVSVMLIGNSYVLNFADQIEENFKLNYSEFRYISIIASYGTFVSNWKISQQAMEITKKQIETYKPDVLFILPRYMQEIKNPIQENDTIVQEMNANIAFYEKFTKKIYILDALPQFSDNFFTLFLHYLVSRPEDLELLHLNKKKADLDMKNTRKRLRMIECKKCQLLDLSHVFAENDKYLTFNRDTMLSFIDNSVHLTTAGTLPCEPILKNITKEILNGF